MNIYNHDSGPIEDFITIHGTRVTLVGARKISSWSIPQISNTFNLNKDDALRVRDRVNNYIRNRTHGEVSNWLKSA